MQSIRLLFALLFLFSASFSFSQTKSTAVKPNIIYILTDDLGYGDIGVFFQKQRQLKNDRSEPFMMTPNLDEMANKGATLEHYSAAPVCAPSRASLLLGVSQGHANVRDNQFDKALEDNHTVGNVLQKAGYKTVLIGKWGLQGDPSTKGGSDWPAHPLDRGFDYYYGYIRHMDGHEHYPKEGIYRGKTQVWDNRNEVSDGLDKAYTGDLFTSRTKKYITDHQKGKDADKPFFIYLAYDTPHAVLELPTQAYPEGSGLNGGLQWIGKPGNMINTASGTPDSWVHPDYANATYDHDKNASTPEIAWPDTYKRYATVVRRIDDQVGDILHLLKDLKIDKNTLVVFSSDNGPSEESYLPKGYDYNKLTFFENYGPFVGIKRDLLEGGIRVPTIAYWPNHIAAKTEIKTPSISYDWMPTFLDAAGLPKPARADGVSLLPSLTGNGQQKTGVIYTEYVFPGKSLSYTEFSENNRGRLRNQMQMMRIGDTVALRYDIKSADDDFELYDIVKDPSQANNLAGPNTAVLQNRMKARSLQIRMPNSSAKRPYDDALIPATHITGLAHGLKWKSFKGNYPWLANLEESKVSKSGKIKTLDLSKIKTSKGNNFIVEGYIDVPQDGKYTFAVKAEGKAFVRIHEAAVIDADYGYTSGDWKEGQLLLKKGLHPVRIYYSTSNTAKPNIHLEWEGPSIKRQKISTDYLFTSTNL